MLKNYALQYKGCLSLDQFVKQTKYIPYFKLKQNQIIRGKGSTLNEKNPYCRYYKIVQQKLSNKLLEYHKN